MAQENIICYRQGIYQIDILVYGCYSIVDLCQRRNRSTLFPAQNDFSMIRVNCTGENLDQCGLSRTVLSDNAMNLALMQLEFHIIQNDDTGVALCDVRQPEYFCSQHLKSPNTP